MELNINHRKGKKVYNLRFYNLTDLYAYMKSDPEVNFRVFPSLSSTTAGKSEFYGDPLPDAIEYIRSGYNRGLNNFLKASSNLSKIGEHTENNYGYQLAVYGNVAIPALVAQGVNECMIRNDNSEDIKVINVLFNLSYPAVSSESQIRNRGLATLYIIQTLEAKGYLINFQAFELSKCNDELFNLSIDLKKPGDQFLDVEKCYYPMVGKEFLRRILFRILESTPLEDREWYDGYGISCSTQEMREFMGASEKDIVISSPREMDIHGGNIYRDTLNLIENLHIEDEFDIKKLKLLCDNNN